jgi:hypothetical protein
MVRTLCVGASILVMAVATAVAQPGTGSGSGSGSGSEAEAEAEAEAAAEAEAEAEAVPLPPPPPRKLTPAEREIIRKACEEERPECDQVALLGSLERQSLEHVLDERRLEIDPAPWGKTVGDIIVYNNRVFSKRDGFLQFFNHFHRTTRDYITEREVIIQPGDPWAQTKADETARRLRDPVFSSLVVVMPVKAADPSKVDVLVVTRDVWSLRLNTEYAFQDSRFTYLTFSLSENNFLGLRKLVSLTYEMDLSQAGIGPVYYDPNFLGKHVDLYTRIYALFNRDDLWDRRDFEYEGSQSVIRVNRPIWNLDVDWGGGVEFRHNFSIDRRYQQNSEGHIRLRPYDSPDTAEVEEIPYEYRARTFSLSTGVTRGFGTTVEHRLKAGHQLASSSYEVTDDFAFGADLQADFERDVLPRSEVTSALYVGYELFVPTYRQFRNVGGFDLAEDVRLGPSLETTVSFGLELIGSDMNFIRLNQSASYALPWGADGLLKLSAGISGRFQTEGDDPHLFIDNSASAETRVVTPTLFGWLRLVNEIRFGTMWHETQNRFLSIGGDNGLRGFGINEFDGLRRVVMQTEIRTAPVPFLFSRWGLVAFHDVGGAAASLQSMRLHNDLGAGVRLLLPQMSSQILRFDFAFPLDGPTVGTFRFTAGFQSAF